MKYQLGQVQMTEEGWGFNIVNGNRAPIVSFSCRGRVARSPRAPSAAPHRMSAMESAAAGASRSVAAAHRRLGRVGLLTLAASLARA
jgi:hypothetical protein